MKHLVDFILFRFEMEAGAAAGLAAAAQRFCAQSPLPLTLHRAAWAPQSGHAYVYGRLATRSHVDAGELAPLEQAICRELPPACDVSLSRLELVFDAPGHSAAAKPAFHYVVETDADEGWMPEISRWYDTEHMPGLAAVPGCIHARRLVNHDSGPASFACYDLLSAETLGSPAWLAVRGTAWSDIARPHFTNTRRTMFEAVG